MGTRLILLSIAALFLGGLIFFGNRLSAGFRDRFLSIFPKSLTTKPTATPTRVPFGALVTVPPQPETAADTPAETASQGAVEGVAQTKDGLPEKSSTAAKEIPNTGPEDTVWFLLGISLLSGFFLRKHAFRVIKK